MKRHLNGPYGMTECGRPNAAGVLPSLRQTTCLRCLTILRGKAETEVIVSRARLENEEKRLALIEKYLEGQRRKSQKQFDVVI